MKRLPENEVRWPKQVATPAEAVRFIDATGYCMLFPVKNVALPSLYYAVARDKMRHEPHWDEFIERVWTWKDALGKQRRAFYAKYFRGRGTFISLKMLPHFLAMRDAAAGPADAGRFYTDGRISHDARAIWEALEKHGPLATLEWRHACKMDSKPGNTRFKRAAEELQRLLIVVHSGTEKETGAWASNRFELVSRAFPKAAESSRRISPEEARKQLAAKYLEWHPKAHAADLARLFGWGKVEAHLAMQLNRPFNANIAEER